MFYLVLFEYLSINYCKFVKAHSYIKILSRIAKKGYKISVEDLKKYENSKTSDSKRRLDKIMKFIPVVNIIYSHVTNKKMVNDTLNDEEFINNLMPLNKEEKKKSETIKNDFDMAILCTQDVSSKEDIKEISKFNKDDLKMVVKNSPSIDEGTCNLICEPMPYLSYTYDEVMKLSSALPLLKTKFGNADGRSVAIIGLIDTNFKNVSFNQNIYKYKCEFIEYTEEEAMNHRYVVYPYLFGMEQSDELRNAYEEIEYDRDQGMRLVRRR